MRLALVDVDTDLLRLMSTDQALNPSQIVVYLADEQTELLESVRRSCQQVTHRSIADWRSAVNEPDLTAILVGGEPADMEKLRFFAQAGATVLVRHPFGTMVDGFQLQMIQKDTNAQIQPHFEGIDHPQFEAIRDWCASGGTSPIGTIKQVVLTRCMEVVGRADVIRAFSRDVFWIRFVLGQIDRVNAIGVESLNQQDWSHLSVQMVGTGGVVGRWTQLPAGIGQQSRMELIGQDGMGVAELAGNPADWRLRIVSPAPREIELPRWNGPSDLFSRLGRASVERDRQARQRIGDDWENACRSVEIAESVEQSCRRGKTIELFHEEHTEEATFKSVMAAGGCLLLTLILCFMVVLQVVSTVRPEIGAWTGWSFVWKFVVVSMSGFLGLQLLRLLFRKSARS